MKKILFLCLFLFCLTGCGKPYTKRDIIKYIYNNTNSKSFQIINKKVVKLNTDEYDDIQNVWTVHDNTENFNFEVVDSPETAWAHGLDRNLSDNYDDARLNHYAGNYNFEHLVFKEEYHPYFIGYYSSKNDLKNIYNELNIFNTAYNFKRLEIHLTFDVIPTINKTNDQDNAEYDYEFFEVNGDEINDNLLNEFYETYLLYSSFYNIDCPDISEEEKLQTIKEHSYGFYIKNGEKVNYYENYVEINNSISLSTFFYILKNEGFDIEGTPEKYKFIAKNNTYEVINDIRNGIISFRVNGTDAIQDEVYNTTWHHFQINTSAIERFTGLVLSKIPMN